MDRMDELLKIRTFLEHKYSDFPHFHCAEAADLVARILKYPVKAGYFRLPPSKIKSFSDIPDSFRGHAWNYDSTTKEIIDLTPNHMTGGKSNIVILSQSSPEAARYYRSWGVYLHLLYHRKTNRIYKENFAEFLDKA